MQILPNLRFHYFLLELKKIIQFLSIVHRGLLLYQLLSWGLENDLLYQNFVATYGIECIGSKWGPRNWIVVDQNLL